MATPMYDKEWEDQKEYGKQLIAAGGCYALSFWSRTDAERLFPKNEKITQNFIELDGVPIYNSEWIEEANKAIELIQKGIKLLEKKIE